jgi:hypothetical protein
MFRQLGYIFGWLGVFLASVFGLLAHLGDNDKVFFVGIAAVVFLICQALRYMLTGGKWD